MVVHTDGINTIANAGSLETKVDTDSKFPTQKEYKMKPNQAALDAAELAKMIEKRCKSNKGSTYNYRTGQYTAYDK